MADKGKVGPFTVENTGVTGGDLRVIGDYMRVPVIAVRCKKGCRPMCTTCRRTKAPVGRSVAPAMAGGLCDDSCQGYRKEPSPCDLWPGEEREAKAGEVGQLEGRDEH